MIDKPLICYDCGLAITNVHPGITIYRRQDNWQKIEIHVECYHIKEGYCKLKDEKGFNKSKKAKLEREVNGCQALPNH